MKFEIMDKIVEEIAMLKMAYELLEKVWLSQSSSIEIYPNLEHQIDNFFTEERY